MMSALSLSVAVADMPQAWLSIGSNIDREKNIRGAVSSLRAAFGELVLSSVYESNAVGFDGDPFYNMVVGLDAERSVKSLNRCFCEIEEKYGRVRGGKQFSSRTLDIDLLLYGDEVIDEDGIEIPRSEIMQYAFVLRPLAEVIGQMKHPVSGCTYQRLWDLFDQGQQKMRRVDCEFAPMTDPVIAG